ncbi:MAG TPA: HmuY family protein [Polyangiaceae bacterium LLY-WYZ-14_1]|nr:HmuY family protein [Polyangiaceae bacterium LLY-WYZ-14_1]
MMLLERRWNLGWSLLIAAGLVAGCANDLAPSDDGPVPGDDDDDDVIVPGDDDDDDDGIPAVTGAFTHSLDDDGVTITTVADATDTDVWQHLDFDTGFATDPDEAGWDLAFSRFRVRVNGGVSGDGGVEVAALSGTDFDAVTNAPTEGWTSSWEDGDDTDEDPDNVFNNGTDDWYDYELSTHTLTPRDVTYVVATTDGGYVKLAFDGYYDDAGTPAIITFRWAEVDPPTGEVDVPADAVAVDASDRETWVYLSVADQAVVEVADPEESMDWDVAFRRTEVRTNSGTSGPGIGGAREDDSELPFGAIASSTTFGFVADEVFTSARPGAQPTSVNTALGGWFDYNPMGRVVTPGDRTYLLRTASGDYAKLRVWTWDDGRMDISLNPVDRRIDYPSVTVDARDGDEWVYVSLTGARVLEEAPEDPANDLSWDLAFSRTLIRTNGGTSGVGAGGALLLEGETNIVLLTELPTEGFAVDEEFASRPGVDPTSSNRALQDWFDYDGATRTVSPAEVVFAIQTADGDVGALQVDGWDDGIYEVTFSFPGAGRTEL